MKRLIFYYCLFPLTLLAYDKIYITFSDGERVYFEGNKNSMWTGL